MEGQSGQKEHFLTLINDLFILINDLLILINHKSILIYIFYLQINMYTLVLSQPEFWNCVPKIENCKIFGCPTF